MPTGTTAPRTQNAGRLAFTKFEHRGERSRHHGETGPTPRGIVASRNEGRRGAGPRTEFCSPVGGAVSSASNRITAATTRRASASDDGGPSSASATAAVSVPPHVRKSFAVKFGSRFSPMYSLSTGPVPPQPLLVVDPISLAVQVVEGFSSTDAAPTATARHDPTTRIRAARWVHLGAAMLSHPGFARSDEPRPPGGRLGGEVQSRRPRLRLVHSPSNRAQTCLPSSFVRQREGYDRVATLPKGARMARPLHYVSAMHEAIEVDKELAVRWSPFAASSTRTTRPG